MRVRSWHGTEGTVIAMPNNDETCEADLTDVIGARVVVREYECSKCGMSWEIVWAYDYGYCPYCGRMIVNADE